MTVTGTRKINSSKVGIVIIIATTNSYTCHKTTKDPKTCGLAQHRGGDTPTDRTGIEIKGDNKWKTIIQNASNQTDIHYRRSII